MCLPYMCISRDCGTASRLADAYECWAKRRGMNRADGAYASLCLTQYPVHSLVSMR